MKNKILASLYLLSLTSILAAQVSLEVSGGIKVSSLEKDNSASKILVLDTSGVITYRYTSDYFDANSATATSTLNYSADYEDYNGGYNTGGVYIDNNRVYLSGLIRKSPGVPSDDDVICTLPFQYRPMDRILSFGQQSGNPVRIDVLPNGQVLLVGGANGSSDFISLEGVNYRILP